jgi:hypothetical protein
MYAEDHDAWLQEVQARNRVVWDFRRKRFTDLVHIGSLRSRIEWWHTLRRLREWWEGHIGPCKMGAGPQVDYTRALPQMCLAGIAAVLGLGYAAGGETGLQVTAVVMAVVFALLTWVLAFINQRGR